MKYDHILFETKDSVSTLTLNRTDVVNALNRAVVEEISDALKWIP